MVNAATFIPYSASNNTQKPCPPHQQDIIPYAVKISVLRSWRLAKICPKYVELILEINKTVIVASSWCSILLYLQWWCTVTHKSSLNVSVYYDFLWEPWRYFVGKRCRGVYITGLNVKKSLCFAKRAYLFLRNLNLWYLESVRDRLINYSCIEPNYIHLMWFWPRIVVNIWK
jgi:hypothetical protein